MAEGASAPSSPGDASRAPLPEESAEDLFEDAPCGYLSTRPDGTIVRVNRTLLSWTGHIREELVGRRRFVDLLDAGGRIYHETTYAPLLRMQGHVREIAVNLVRADGSKMEVLVNSVLKTDEAGQPAGIRTVVLDVRHRRAYENELLRERRNAEQAVARVRVLQDMAARFAATLSVAGVAGVIVQAAVDAFDAAGSLLWLLDPDNDVLVRVAASTDAPTDRRLNRIGLDEPLPMVQALVRRELVVVPSLDEARRRYPRLAATMAAWSREALVIAPVGTEAAVLGVVALSFGAPRTFSQEELDLLRTLGRQSGQALERARLYEAEQRLRAQGEVLQRMTAVLAAALDPAQIANAVVEELVDNTLVDGAIFAVAATENARFEVLARRSDGGAPAPPVREHTFDDRAAVGRALRTLEPVFCSEPAEQSELFAAARELTGAGQVSSLALLPLVVERRANGVLVLTYRDPRRFSDDERTFLVAFAGQCAQALERARLHEQTAEAARRSAFLAGTSRALDEVQGFRPRVRRLVELIVPALADWAGVSVRGATGTETVAAAGHVPGRPAPLDERGDLVVRAIASGEPVLGGDSEGEVTYAALPMRSRKQTIGALLLARTDSERRFRRGELAFLADLAERAALTLENARLYEHERMVAHTLQQSLLAAEPPRDPRFEVESYYRPAYEALDVGGDWHDAFTVEGDKLTVVVGDVVGRGLDAASAMGQLRSAVRALAGAALGPAEVLERLDGFVAQVEPARMATLAIVEVTLGSGIVRYACAGHPPPALFEPQTGWRLLWDGRSAPLGAYITAARREHGSLVLQPGTRLLLYTDGLVERRDRGLDTGFSRLVEQLDRHRDVTLPALVSDIAASMLLDEQTRDDVCMLCVSFGVADVFERVIEARVGQLAILRRDLRGWLDAHGIETRDRDALVLACSEAAANAVEHGYGGSAAGRIGVAGSVRDDTVEVRVTDEGQWRTAPPDPDRGRGLMMMERLVDEVRVERSEGTTVVLRRAVRKRSSQ